MALLDLLSWTAIVATVGLFLSGILQCQQMVTSKSTENIPFLPFLTTNFNCLMWASYGYLKGDMTVIFVNATGACLQTLYILCFLYYHKQKATELRQLLYVVIVAVCLYVYIVYMLTGKEERTWYLGKACIIVTVTMQASPFAAVAEVLRTKSTKSMPFVFSLLITVVSFIWLCYGYLVKDINIQVPNLSGVVLGLIQLSLFVVFPAQQGSQQRKM